jgi:hypothetical protein
MIFEPDLPQSSVTAWVTRGLPARLDVSQTARLLGFAEHDIQILTAAGKLTPLGDPAPNAPKWFGAVEVMRLAIDQDWLNAATKAVGKYWRLKRQRRTFPDVISIGKFQSKPLTTESDDKTL